MRHSLGQCTAVYPADVIGDEAEPLAVLGQGPDAEPTRDYAAQPQAVLDGVGAVNRGQGVERAEVHQDGQRLLEVHRGMRLVRLTRLDDGLERTDKFPLRRLASKHMFECGTPLVREERGSSQTRV